MVANLIAPLGRITNKRLLVFASLLVVRGSVYGLDGLPIKRCFAVLLAAVPFRIGAYTFGYVVAAKGLLVN